MNKPIFVLLLFLYTSICIAQGQEWELFWQDNVGPIAVDPTDSDKIYIAADSSGKVGMWKTIDRGKSWRFYNEGWNMGSPRKIFIDPENTGIIFVCGGPFVGLLKSSDAGKNWQRADYGFVTNHHGYLISDIEKDTVNNVYYVANYNDALCGIYTSGDGVQWEKVSIGFDCMISIIIADKPGLIYGGDVIGAWRSEDFGKSWTQTNDGLPTENGYSPNIWIHEKIYSSNTLYASVRFRGLYKSANGGTTWFPVNDTIMNYLEFSSIALSRLDTNVVFAGSYATLNPEKPGGIYISHDAGKTWINFKRGLPDSLKDISVRYLALDEKKNILYAGLVLYYSDNHSEFHTYNLKNAVITSLNENNSQPISRDLKINGYPNPFNNSVTLQYYVPAAGTIKIKIYDLQGREVRTLVNKSEQSGNHSIHWDSLDGNGQALASGLYMIVMQTSNQRAYHKLLLLK